MVHDDAAADDPPVITQVDEDVAWVRLNRPDRLNAITLGTLRGLIDAAGAVAERTDLRAVVLSGAGRSFCAGLDFAEVLGDRDGIRASFAPIAGGPGAGSTNTFQEACWAWRRLEVPVIAAVRGHCLGGGLQIALGADIRFTTPDAQWSVLESKWGLIPDMTGIQSLSEQVGLDRAKLLTMTGRMLTGTDAVRFGLATEAVADPDAAARDLIAELRTRSPDAVAGAKRAFEQTWHAEPATTFATERQLQARLLAAPNTQEAQRAGLNRTTPEFGPRGRLAD